MPRKTKNTIDVDGFRNYLFEEELSKNTTESGTQKVCGVINENQIHVRFAAMFGVGDEQNLCRNALERTEGTGTGGSSAGSGIYQETAPKRQNVPGTGVNQHMV